MTVTTYHKINFLLPLFSTMLQLFLEQQNKLYFCSPVEFIIYTFHLQFPLFQT